MNKDTFIPHRKAYETEVDPLKLSEDLYTFQDKRRSVRQFSDRPVSKDVIEALIKTASTAPSGAHKQPWTFCAVSNPDLKLKIREAAEKEEYENYHGRMSEDWLEDLKQFDTDWHKEFLTIAPWLIIVLCPSAKSPKEITRPSLSLLRIILSDNNKPYVPSNLLTYPIWLRPEF